MTLWTIEPRVPIIVRDGKPFDINPGARAESLDFPVPSTVAGAVRSRHWQQQGNSFASDTFGNAEARTLNQLAVKGPLLVERAPTGQLTWFAPAPNDAVLFPMEEQKDKEHVRLRKLSPGHDASHQVFSDLQGGWQTVAMSNPLKDKPLNRPPRYWQWQQFEEWLIRPADRETIAIPDVGHSGPIKENRVHVSIRLDTQTGEEGRLFQTSGLEFQRVQENQVRSLALAVEIAGDMSAGLDTLGGEQRLVRWRKQEGQLPTCPPQVREAILQQGRCRLILLTPAFFRRGYQPQEILTEVAGLTITIEAAIVQRPQTVSGWDFHTGRAKPTRRLVPAGAVYFLRLDGSPDLIDLWLQRVWMATISDRVEIQVDPTRHLHQDRLDGFGLAVVGVWN